MRISDWSSDVCSSDLQDRDRARNEADRYRNDILPRARGEALRVVQGAEAYKERLENEAEGEAQRFLSVYNAYRQNPDVTRRRMYLETRSEEHTSELQSLMRISYAVFCLKKKIK